MHVSRFILGSTLATTAATVGLAIQTGSIWLSVAMFFSGLFVSQLLYLTVLTETANRHEIRRITRRRLRDEFGARPAPAAAEGEAGSEEELTAHRLAADAGRPGRVRRPDGRGLPHRGAAP